MESQLIKASYCTPASFEERINGLTTPQKALIFFLREKASNSEIITRDSLLDFYIQNVKGSEFYKVYGTKPHPNPVYTHRITDYENFQLKPWKGSLFNKNTCLAIV